MFPSFGFCRKCVAGWSPAAQDDLTPAVFRPAMGWCGCRGLEEEEAGSVADSLLRPESTDGGRGS